MQLCPKCRERPRAFSCSSGIIRTYCLTCDRSYHRQLRKRIRGTERRPVKGQLSRLADFYRPSL